MAANTGLNTGAPTPSASSGANANNTPSDASAPYSPLAESTMGGYTEGGTRTPDGLDGGLGFNLDLPAFPGYENDGDNSESGTNEYDQAAGVVDPPADVAAQSQSAATTQDSTGQDSPSENEAARAGELGEDGKPLPFNEHPAWQRRIQAEKAAKAEAETLRAELESIRSEQRQREEQAQQQAEEERIAQEVEERYQDRFDLSDEDRQAAIARDTERERQISAREFEVQRQIAVSNQIVQNYEAQQRQQHLAAAEQEFPALADSVELPGENGQSGTFKGTDIVSILYSQQMALWQTQAQQAHQMGQTPPTQPDIAAIARDFGRYITGVVERKSQDSVTQYAKTKTTQEAQTPVSLGRQGGGGAVPVAPPKSEKPTGRTIFSSIKLPW